MLSENIKWLFVRLFPVLLIGSVAGILLTRKKDAS